MEDQKIIDLFLQRKDDAIDQTSQKYGKYCYAIAWNILSNRQDAEECVNDTWLNAWNAIPPHRPERLRPFLGKITRACAFNRCKAQRAQKRGGGELPLILEELESCLPAAPSAAEETEAAALEDSVSRFLHTLPEQECSIFLRRYWFAEPLSEIARRYGLNLNTVKSSLHRSRGKLKRHLEREELLP